MDKSKHLNPWNVFAIGIVIAVIGQVIGGLVGDAITTGSWILILAGLISGIAKAIKKK